jgi:hypothetical protein
MTETGLLWTSLWQGSSQYPDLLIDPCQPFQYWWCVDISCRTVAIRNILPMRDPTRPRMIIDIKYCALL